MRKNPDFNILIFHSFICILLLIARMLYAANFSYSFMAWNLFLAWIPLWAASSLKQEQKKYTSAFLLFFWLLFFPNAPYIITDLFHLKQKSNIPLWFDLILILSFAWSGLLLGFISLYKVRNFLNKKYGNFLSRMAVFAVLLLSSFGIYLGRYLRWNSWDIITNPFGLFTDVINILFHPFSNPRAIGFTLLFSVLLTSIYYGIQLISSIEKQANENKVKTEGFPEKANINTQNPA